MNRIIIFAIVVFAIACYFSYQKTIEDDFSVMEDYKLTDSLLIEQVKLAINPTFKNWILFKNGTYIIMEDTSDVNEIEKEGIEKMKEFGPVHAGSSAGDFGITTLTETEGWVVSGHGYGMYTYVHPSELELKNPKDHEVGFFGRNKRDLDGSSFEIICISANGEFIQY